MAAKHRNILFGTSLALLALGVIVAMMWRSPHAPVTNEMRQAPFPNQEWVVSLVYENGKTESFTAQLKGSVGSSFTGDAVSDRGSLAEVRGSVAGSGVRFTVHPLHFDAPVAGRPNPTEFTGAFKNRSTIMGSWVYREGRFSSTKGTWEATVQHVKRGAESGRPGV